MENFNENFGVLFAFFRQLHAYQSEAFLLLALYLHRRKLFYSISHVYKTFNRPFALTSQILRVSSRCSLTISVRVQQPHTAQELTILIQNYYKLLKNLLCLQKLYYAYIANLSSRCIVTGAMTSCAGCL